MPSRNALYFAAFLPGVETAGGPRGATISGLPNNTINITIDGISTGNQLQSTDGFFSMVTPRLDAVEEITVTGATPGAGSGPGAVQIAFTTRSGTNEFNSSIYHYFRHPQPELELLLQQDQRAREERRDRPPVRRPLGGPIVIPGLFDGRNKAFFFFNFEHHYQPSEATRTRTILNPEAQHGVFTYLTVGGGSSAHRQPVRARGGATARPRRPIPSIAALLDQIRAATDDDRQRDARRRRDQHPEFRLPGGVDAATSTRRPDALDYNLTDSHRLTGTYCGSGS